MDAATVMKLQRAHLWFTLHACHLQLSGLVVAKQGSVQASKQAKGVMCSVHAHLFVTCLHHELCYLDCRAASQSISHGIKDAVLSPSCLHACILQAVQARTVTGHNAADDFLHQSDHTIFSTKDSFGHAEHTAINLSC